MHGTADHMICRTERVNTRSSTIRNLESGPCQWSFVLGHGALVLCSVDGWTLIRIPGTCESQSFANCCLTVLVYMRLDMTCMLQAWFLRGPLSLEPRLASSLCDFSDFELGLDCLLAGTSSSYILTGNSSVLSCMHPLTYPDCTLQCGLVLARWEAKKP